MEYKTTEVDHTREEVMNMINRLSLEDRHKICKTLMKEYAQYDVKLLLCAICGKKLYTHYKEEDQMFDRCGECEQIVCTDCNFNNDKFSSCGNCEQIYCLICKGKDDVCSSCAHYNEREECKYIESSEEEIENE